MQECDTTLVILTAKESLEVRSTEVVEKAGAHIDGPRLVQSKRIIDQEANAEALGGSHSARRGDKGRVEVDPDDLDVFSEMSPSSEPPRYVAGTAADIDDPDRRGGPDRTGRCNDGPQEPRDTSAVLEFFGEPLELRMNTEEQRIDGGSIQLTIVLWNSGHDAGCATVSERLEARDHIRASNGLAGARDRVEGHDDIGDLWSVVV
jgi:hypothetical protein